MVKTRHGMKVIMATEAELEAEGRPQLSSIPANCDVSSTMLPWLMLGAGAHHPPVLCLRLVAGQNFLGRVGLFTLSQCIVHL